MVVRVAACVRATAALVRGREEAARQFEARSEQFDDAHLQGMNGGQIFAELMRQHGVKHVFGYPGGAILPVFDGMHQSEHFDVILPRHEQGAGHMAEGYARATGKPGVVVVTSGPGATNTITPMQDAMSDGIPLVVFTGQVPTTAIGSDAFQEADVLGISRFCTKWSINSSGHSALPSASQHPRTNCIDASDSPLLRLCSVCGVCAITGTLW